MRLFKTLIIADIDKDGQVDAANGLILLRYLFGLTGDPLVAGVISYGAKRFTQHKKLRGYIINLFSMIHIKKKWPFWAIFLPKIFQIQKSPEKMRLFKVMVPRRNRTTGEDFQSTALPTELLERYEVRGKPFEAANCQGLLTRWNISFGLVYVFAIKELFSLFCKIMSGG